MAATIRFNDGKEVELSEETTKKLRAELVKPEHPIATVCNFLDGDKRLILNLSEYLLIDRYKHQLIVLDENGGSCYNSILKSEPLPNYYKNHKKVF